MATETVRFTKQTVEAITPPATGHRDYRDTENKYLHIRATAAGGKTFYLIRKIAGKVHFIKLGGFPELTVQQARKSCEEQAASLLRGDHPKRKPDKLTFGELFTRYMMGHAKPHKRTWEEDENNFRRYLKPLAKKPVVDINRAAITRLHTAMGSANGKYIANKVLALLKVVFNYGHNTLGLAIDNPAQGVKLFREESRDRFLDAEELKSFFDALYNRIKDEDTKKHTSEQWQDFFSLALWTGARRGNVQAMQWQHIDLTTGLWRIPGSEFKNGHPCDVVLSEPALEILTRRKLNATGKHVFPSNSKSGHIEEPKKAWASILERAELENVRLHDLRRTLGSWQAATGASLQVIGKTLGHRNQSTTAIYSRLNLDPVKASLSTATAAMLEAINGDEK
jgi:integrase